MEATAKKDMPTIGQDRLGLAEHKRREWVVDIPIGITLADVLEPSYWAHVAATMDPMDHIEVRAEDGSWVAYLIVRFCERNYARMALDRLVKLDANTERPSSSLKHNVEWKGPLHKWSVIRIADSAMLHNGEKSKELAYAWLIEHERTLGT